VVLFRRAPFFFCFFATLFEFMSKCILHRSIFRYPPSFKSLGIFLLFSPFLPNVSALPGLRFYLHRRRSFSRAWLATPSPYFSFLFFARNPQLFVLFFSRCADGPPHYRLSPTESRSRATRSLTALLCWCLRIKNPSFSGESVAVPSSAFGTSGSYVFPQFP